jgi:hypothetical protein
VHVPASVSKLAIIAEKRLLQIELKWAYCCEHMSGMSMVAGRRLADLARALGLVLALSPTVRAQSDAGSTALGGRADAGTPLDASIETTNPFELPGTQPMELTQPLREPVVCGGCHGYYDETSPNESWEGSMMANATRDPLFHAALAIANQDEPGSGDLCVRCHSPRGWLFGRSSPPELATLIEDDYEGVSCDFCHRLVPADPLLIGTGQYTVADDFVRRGPFDDAQSEHESEYSAYHESAELCGLCHDVSNPAEGHFPIERTYTEWKSSAFPAEGVTCQRCHMPRQTGFAAGARNLPEREIGVHELAGGNTWVPRVLAGEHPELSREDAYERTAQAATRMLQSAARVSLEPGPAPGRGDVHELSIRVENLTGHKLPTGYPEGRRCWLEVEVVDAKGQRLLHSGEYDLEQAERIEDDQLRTYEVKMADDGLEGFHFVLQNQLLQDNRIPPRGFVSAPDTQPVGRNYPIVADAGDAEILAHWDIAPYSFTVPRDAPGPLSVRARLWYQTTSREYVTFLRDENQTDSTGDRLYELWEAYDRAPPVMMSELIASLVLEGDEPPIDAGVPGDAGAPDRPVTDTSVETAALDAAVPEGAPLVHPDAGGPPTGNPDAETRFDGSVTADDAGSMPTKSTAHSNGLLDASHTKLYVDAQESTGADASQPARTSNSSEGCDCAVGSRPPTWSACVLAFLLAFALRRRSQAKHLTGVL